MEWQKPLVLIYFLILVCGIIFISINKDKKSIVHPLVLTWMRHHLNHQNRLTQISLWFKSHFALILRILCLIFLGLAAARPQNIIGERKDPNEALDMMLALDASGSMRALDFKINGQASDRMQALKKVLGDFLLKRTDDRIGLVIFGKEAFTQAPLTLDHQLLARLIELMEIGMAGDATAIGDAIATAAKRLEKIEARSKIIILLTDGQNTAGTLDPKIAARAASDLGIKIYTIGIGQKGKVPIPVQTPFGQRIVHQELGLDENTLKEIAQDTGGGYFRAYNTEELQGIYEKINQLEKSKRDLPRIIEKDEAAGPYLFIAAIFLFLECYFIFSKYQPLLPYHSDKGAK